MRYLFILFMVYLSLIQLASAEEFCFPNVEFKTMPKIETKEITISEDVKLKISQTLASQVVSNMRIASNIMCQKLYGARYTGSLEEWRNFINSNVKELVSAGNTDIELTLVSDEEKVYHGELEVIEYTFKSLFHGEPQTIVNLAVLEREKNLVANFAVSGHSKVVKEINQEFKRLVSFLK